MKHFFVFALTLAVLCSAPFSAPAQNEIMFKLKNNSLERTWLCIAYEREETKRDGIAYSTTSLVKKITGLMHFSPGRSEDRLFKTYGSNTKNIWFAVIRDNSGPMEIIGDVTKANIETTADISISTTDQYGGILKGFSLDGISGFYYPAIDFKYIKDKRLSFYLLNKTPGKKNYQDMWQGNVMFAESGKVVVSR